MDTLVVNCSAPHYNLGARKLLHWLGADGSYFDGDPGMFTQGVERIALSVIFSWHAPIAREIALRFRDRVEIWAGGPGLFSLKQWWKDETGLQTHQGLDNRFDREPGDYKMTFASRGCPVNCSFCIVPRLEGKEFTLNWEFTPAPVLCDNNLSALPIEFQDHIIARYIDTETKLLDANSGFEPRSFDEGTYARWKPILKGPWRFALDEMDELEDVGRMMAILREESPKRKRVYVLIGNEPFSACQERAQKVLEWGGEPFCQPIMKLNVLEKRPWIRHDWTERQVKDFARYYNRFLWKYVPFAEYRREVRTNR